MVLLLLLEPKSAVAVAAGDQKGQAVSVSSKNDQGDMFLLHDQVGDHNRKGDMYFFHRFLHAIQEWNVVEQVNRVIF